MNLRSRNKRKTKSTREKQLAMPALEIVTNYIYTIVLEKIMLAVPPSKIKAPITFTQVMNSEYSREWRKAMELEMGCIKSNEVAVLTRISDVSRNKIILRTGMVGLRQDL